MLTQLTVEDYALIEHLELQLDSRLNIITGETGAGKSILLGALGLLLGAKNDAAATAKDASRNCIIEGTFDLNGLGLEDFFTENELEYDTQTVIRRVISAAGKSRAFVNDEPVQLQTLRDLGARLIDIHSQHQNLILQSARFRLDALDTFAGADAERTACRTAVEALQAVRAELRTLRAENARSQQNEEWLRFQTEELTAAALQAGEIAELEQQQLLLENAEQIQQTLAQSAEALTAEETGTLPILRQLENGFTHIAASYPHAREFAERLHSSLVDLRDIADTLGVDVQRIESDPQKLAEVGERLDTLYTLCRKHNVQTVEELIEVRDRYAAQLAAITSDTERIAALEKAETAAAARADSAAEALHARRSKASAPFAQQIIQTLRQLGMEDTRFEVHLAPAELTTVGSDEAQYLFSANARMPLEAIERTASGGELSRVMLALKALLARHMALPTIIFDEIDTGVSGRIADAMGQIILSLAATMQVVNITHLPQIASKGDRHFVVYKADSQTHIRAVSGEERVDEIAKMLSGSSVTDAAREQARILLGQTAKSKSHA